MIALLYMTIAWGKMDPCLTIELESIGLNDIHPGTPIPPPNNEKSGRDAYQLSNEHLSENFALRWGDNSVGMEEAQRIVDALEHAWTVQINDMGYPQPIGSTSVLFNVYIGDTNGPESYGVSGYFTSDSEGWPMVVLSPNLVSRFDEYKSTIPHEFFHAVQNSAGNWEYDALSGWFWESTAVYMEYETLPNDPMYSVFLFGFAFLPHKALNFFDYFDTGAIQEYYQYGAFLFSKYLTEYPFDSTWIRDAWINPGLAPDPLTYLRDRTRESGINFEELTIDFASRNAVLDYEHEEWYRYYLDYYADYFPGDDHRITAGISSFGSQGWKSPNHSLRPERYGSNHLELKQPAVTELLFEFEGDLVGSQGSEAIWNLRLSREINDQITYESASIVDGIGQMQLLDLTPDETLIWTIMPSSEIQIMDEYFSYRYRVSEIQPAEDTDNAPKDSTCKGCEGSKGLIFASPLALLFSMRRRRLRSGV